MRKKICIITGSRAEWGLFYPLAKEIRRQKSDFALQIIATGAHFSQRHGLTYKEICRDGFKITKAVPLTVSQDTEQGILRAFGGAVISLGKALRSARPDLVILLGDRFETFAAAVACLFEKIPVAHIHGGELTEGSLDDMMRHSVTKLAHIHFTSHEEHKKRVIQMGEDPSRVFCVGALALDNINGRKLLSKKTLEDKLRFKLGKDTLMVTFNPPTASGKLKIERQFKNLLDALDELKSIKVIFTKSSPDIHSKTIARLSDRYISSRSKKCIVRSSLGREVYLSLLKYTAAVVGNSSSGLIEAPSLGVPTVNIGDRQKGRLCARSVINCEPEKLLILKSIRKALGKNFREECKKVKNPYDKGSASRSIVSVLKRTRIDSDFIKKRFHDLWRYE